MTPENEYTLLQTRRQFFGDTGLRLGGVALAMLMGDAARRTARASGSVSGAPAASSSAAGTARVHPPLPGSPHHKPTAKALIYLHMNGGPSQIDTWDYKPELQKFFDKDLPPSV